jgi:molybdate transport system substrate-binding protein
VRQGFGSVVLVVAAALTAACSNGSDGQTLLVFGAASLSDVLMTAEDEFEQAHPDVDVQLNVGGSSALREQILNGAPADVFVPANLAILQEVFDAGDMVGQYSEVTVVASNRVVIAVQPGNPVDLTGLKSFERAELLLGVCNRSVPCGALAYQSFEAFGVAPSIDTEEPDVRSLLTKIVEGELDAGIVYFTDVVAARGGVQVIDLPDSVELRTEYAAGITANSENPERARDFVDFLSSERGQELFRKRGFAGP